MSHIIATLLVCAVIFAAGYFVLTILHELGHWIVAKGCGAWAPRFSIGVGKPYIVIGRLFGTEFRLSRNLYGGMVSLVTDPIPDEQLLRAYGEFGFDIPPIKKMSYPRNMAILSAGMLVEVLVAAALLAALSSDHGFVATITATGLRLGQMSVWMFGLGGSLQIQPGGWFSGLLQMLALMSMCAALYQLLPFVRPLKSDGMWLIVLTLQRWLGPSIDVRRQTQIERTLRVVSLAGNIVCLVLSYHLLVGMYSIASKLLIG